MVRLILKCGHSFLLEEEDAFAFKRFGFRCDGRYLVAWVNNKKIYFHRFVLKAKTGEEVDHKNGNKMDNRRENLRFCSRQLNLANGPLLKSNTSGFRGVSWQPRGRKWIAFINKGKKKFHLGTFVKKIDAAKAYNDAALHLFGSFAYINHI